MAHLKCVCKQMLYLYVIWQLNFKIMPNQVPHLLSITEYPTMGLIVPNLDGSLLGTLDLNGFINSGVMWQFRDFRDKP